MATPAVNRLMATATWPRTDGRDRPHASTRVTAVGSSERSTAPGIEARNRSNSQESSAKRGAGQAARERAVVNGDRTHEQADRLSGPA